MVSTLDTESSVSSSNLGETWLEQHDSSVGRLVVFKPDGEPFNSQSIQATYQDTETLC